MPSPDSLVRLPAPGDNCAIAAQPLAAGTELDLAGRRLVLASPILVGHRFAVQPLAPGDPLLSWGLPFGRATRPIPAGGYVCNQAMLDALRARPIPFALPEEPNFEDDAARYVLDEAGFRPGTQVAPHAEARTFLGYPRSGGRGAGTRNFIVLLGITSRVGSFVRALETRLKALAASLPNLDGIVAVAHTEGAGPEPLNNRDLLRRVLAGFLVHPNAGAVLVVDDDGGLLLTDDVLAYARAAGYPIDAVPHAALRLTGDFEADLVHGEAHVRGWLPEVAASARVPVPLARLTLALQCGGSDAFSGVSANPLAGAVAREVIRYGGAACLAETTELVGAESYVLRNVRDLDTARAFLGFIQRYKDLLDWHGASVEGNPSGGNRYRGLYNVILKSVGAAAKLDPAVRLDYAVDYGERLPGAGYTFMHSPGNDLESIAGQVAGGCNLIVFTTGNGSITNFPFVPTLKVMTTTARYNLLAREMDFNAGAYLDGTPLEDLTRAALDLAVALASGERSKGEQAGHTQVSLWRNWRQTSPGQAARLAAAPEPDGRPVPVRPGDHLAAPVPVTLRRLGGRLATDHVGLILPTSLCAGQVARLAADRLNALGLGRVRGLSRFVALVHTEGCGSAGRASGALYRRTLLSYVAHPLVARGLFLEHGCEKTHNDSLRADLLAAGVDLARYGWASIQLDGGLDAVLNKIEAWFRAATAGLPESREEHADLGALRLGLLTAGPVAPPLASALARLTRIVVTAGGTVVVPEAASLLQSEDYVRATLAAPPAGASLAFGRAAIEPGFHLLEMPTVHWIEMLTGLGASGVEVALAVPGARPAQAHPLVPVLQVALADREGTPPGFDLLLSGDPAAWAEQMLWRVAEVASRRYTPRRVALGDVDFQVTRGLTGVST
jgi:altronate dehydratase